MKIKLKNIGPISYSEFELGKLTVVSGKNNTGKTYVTYLLYCLLDFWTNEFVIQVSDDVKTSITSKGIAKIELQQYVIHANDVLKRASRQFSTPNVLARVFASEAEKFKDSEISIEIDKDEIDIAGHSKETSEFSLGIKNKSYIKITQENNCLNIKLLVGTAELPDPSLLNIIERSISDIIKRLYLDNYYHTLLFLVQNERDLLYFKRTWILQHLKSLKFFGTKRKQSLFVHMNF